MTESLQVVCSKSMSECRGNSNSLIVSRVEFRRCCNQVDNIFIAGDVND